MYYLRKSLLHKQTIEASKLRWGQSLDTSDVITNSSIVQDLPLPITIFMCVTHTNSLRLHAAINTMFNPCILIAKIASILHLLVAASTDGLIKNFLVYDEFFKWHVQLISTYIDSCVYDVVGDAIATSAGAAVVKANL